MILVSIAVLCLSLGLYRALAVSLPFFSDTVLHAPLNNLLCGAASDLSLIALLGTVMVASGWGLPRRASGIIAAAITAIVVAALAAHIRYVEHFGMNVRPFHFVAFASHDVWFVGPVMVFQSWRADLILAAAVVEALLLSRLLLNKNNDLIAMKGRRRALVLIAAAVLYAASNGTTINLRQKVAVHRELRYNIFTSLYYNLGEYAKVRALPMPQREDLLKLRTMLAGGRVYVDQGDGKDFPLWQARIPSSAIEDGSEAAGMRDELRTYLAAERAAKGPWNVILVISESLRAEEVQAVGPVVPSYQGIQPQFDALGKESIAFTEVIGAGLRTHFGQTTAQCSLYGAEEFTILNGAPMANAVCLSDVFARRGYATHFFYAADNHFDNQDVFYRHHNVQKVHGYEEFPPDAPKGGWGIGDGALFKLAGDVLAKETPPFFATILTLTNHAPFAIPSDMPASVLRKGLPMQLQMFQYADWTSGEFFKFTKEKLPHTIFILIADHGGFRGEPVIEGLPAYALVRQVARVPWFIAVPGMPKRLQGAKINRIVSNVDVPPTLLSLLGWVDEPQQFMGEDAFVRQGPVYIDWLSSLLELRDRSVHAVPQAVQDVLGSAGRYDLLAPGGGQHKSR